ncbi:type IV secretion system protein [Treponema sp. OMZ 799]|uniref:type IV secretion system protein n=1 Tax=Treponema sp. OMZ 799 TaxID=2563668 RepID=UPI0020A410B9|nr:type IV secretion system protein [Treponema sp. OMZ 799]UTC77070.1 type IV secretion system protein [Treponema sp. OMZ 799]UTC78255.1 type IV secretion system protein [Treponema sp. OMZ 799]
MMTYYKEEPPKELNPQFKEYDRIIGLQNKENRTWRIIAVASLSFLFLSLLLLLYAIKLPKTIPMVITVSEYGEAKYVGNVSKLSYSNMKVPDIAIQYQIKRFVTNMNTITSDAQVMKQNIRDCYNMLSGDAGLKLSNILKNDNPFDKFGDIKQSILLESILQLSPQSYQVDYIQSKITMTGVVTDRTRYRGIISIALLEPPEDKKIENPLGIYISDFDFTKVNTLTQGDK